MLSKKIPLVFFILTTAIATLNRCDSPAGDDNGESWHYGPWEYYQLKIEARALYFLSPDSGWACGGGPAFLKYNGTKWFLFEDLGNEERYVSCRDMDFSGPADGWAVGNTSYPSKGHVFHFDGTGWEDVTPFDMEYVYCVAAVAPDDVWVGANEVIYHYDGSAWDETPFFHRLNVEALTFPAPDDGWAIASGYVFHFNGDEWTLVRVNFDARAYDIFFPTPDEGWTVGGNILPEDFTWHPIMHYKNGEWMRTFRADFVLQKAYFAARDDGWAVGTHVLRYDGNEWHVITPPGKLYAYDVFTLGGDEVWLACNYGTICKYNPNKK